jgi:chromosome segregation ATPase
VFAFLFSGVNDCQSSDTTFKICTVVVFMLCRWMWHCVDCQELRVTMGKMAVEADASAATIAALTKQVHAVGHDGEAERKQLHKREQEIARLRHDLEVSVSKLEAQGHEQQATLRELINSRLKASRLEQSLRETEVVLARTQDELQTMTNKCDHQAADMRNIATERVNHKLASDTLTRTVSDRDSSIASLQTMVASLQSTIATQTTDLKTSAVELDTVRKQAKSLETSLSVQKSMTERMQEQVRTLKTEVSEAAKQRRQLESDVVKLKRDLVMSNPAAASGQASNDAEAKRLKLLEEDLKRNAEESIATVQSELDRARQDVTFTRTQIQVLTDTMKQLEGELALARQPTAGAAAAATAGTSDAKSFSFRAQIMTMMAQQTQLRNQLAEQATGYEIKIATLKKQLKEFAPQALSRPVSRASSPLAAAAGYMGRVSPAPITLPPSQPPVNMNGAKVVQDGTAMPAPVAAVAKPTAVNGSKDTATA